MFMFGLKCFDDHARGDAQAITTYEDAMAYIEQQKSGMPQEEQQAFDRTIMDVHRGADACRLFQKSA